MKMSKIASAANFAHLLGISAKKAEDDEDKKDSRRAEDDQEDDDKKSRRADDSDKDYKERADDDNDEDAEDGDDKKSKKSKRAEDDSDDEDDKKSKRADDEKDDDKMEDDGDDDEEEMRGKSAVARARRRERARCAAIFRSKMAGKNPVLAANLAFNTSMTRKEALAVLENTPAAQSFGGDRSARNPSLGSDATRSQNPSSRWDAAFKKATGRR